MNNHLFTEVSTLLSADMATLVAVVLNSGRVTFNADSSFTVDGISLAPNLPAGGGQTKVVQKSVNKIQFDGKNWTFQFDGMAVIEPDRVGLHYITQSVQRSRKKSHVTDLVTGAYGEPVDVMQERDLLEGDVAVESIEDDDGNAHRQQVITTEFHDEILSDEDRGFVLNLLEQEYKNLAKLERKGLPREVLIKKEEIKKIEEYLEVHRYRGKNVLFDTRAEKDRKSVAKAIREAIAKIAKKHPSLAEHLRKLIKTGFYCSYEPEPEVHWVVAIRWRPVSPE